MSKWRGRFIYNMEHQYFYDVYISGQHDLAE